MRHLSFRTKLLLAIMLVVVGLTATSLLVVRRRMATTYERFFQKQSEAQNRASAALRDARLNVVRENCIAFAKGVRLVAALDELRSDENAEAVTLLYDNAKDAWEAPEALGNRSLELKFLRFFNSKGIPLPRTGLEPSISDSINRALIASLSSLGRRFTGPNLQEMGYISLPSSAGTNQLIEVVLTKVIDPVNNAVLGAMALGTSAEENTRDGGDDIETGIWVGNELFSRTIESAEIPTIVAYLTKQTAKPIEDHSPVKFGGVPHLIFHQSIAAGDMFPKAEQVSLYSLAELNREQRDFTWKAAIFACAGLLAALGLSLFLAHNLSVPLTELVWGTRQIQEGNFTVKVPVRSRDELGRLAGSFNEMAEGLALKEKYRSVLDLVADKEIARDLMDNKIALGGEMREVSVLFCDIRGFTPLTEKMEPNEVITMLNEHFTPLTRVVYEHHGVVDKFVGDLIMAIFGAPKSFGNDALNAVNCGLRMIEERTKLNQTSKYQIRMGIGIATGSAVAGRMGSNDRLSYTVLGERVNLASRLCGQAGPMELVVDDNTIHKIGAAAAAEEMPPLQLKGFAMPVAAFKLKRCV